MFSKFREPVSGLTHLGGAIASVGGLTALLVVGWQGVEKIISVLIYGLSLVGLFTASATYHLARVKPKTLTLLRKIDHSAIYLLIAGTYTPFCVNAFSGFYRWGLLTIIWSIALAGILVKVFYIHAPRWLSAGVYVLMGWLCVAAIGEMTTALTSFTLAFLLAGGIVYTLGAVVYAAKLFNFVPGKFGFHEMWHIFVLVGALSHFVAVMGVIWPAG
ncbi:MAG: hemolysin III family protein [Anaerolineales bacterium]